MAQKFKVNPPNWGDTVLIKSCYNLIKQGQRGHAKHKQEKNTMAAKIRPATWTVAVSLSQDILRMSGQKQIEDADEMNWAVDQIKAEYPDTWQYELKRRGANMENIAMFEGVTLDE